MNLLLRLSKYRSANNEDLVEDLLVAYIQGCWCKCWRRVGNQVCAGQRGAISIPLGLSWAIFEKHLGRRLNPSENIHVCNTRIRMARTTNRQLSFQTIRKHVNLKHCLLKIHSCLLGKRRDFSSASVLNFPAIWNAESQMSLAMHQFQVSAAKLLQF